MKKRKKDNKEEDKNGGKEEGNREESGNGMRKEIQKTGESGKGWMRKLRTKYRLNIADEVGIKIEKRRKLKRGQIKQRWQERAEKQKRIMRSIIFKY